jgi:hypothetical protein
VCKIFVVVVVHSNLCLYVGVSIDYWLILGCACELGVFVCTCELFYINLWCAKFCRGCAQQLCLYASVSIDYWGYMWAQSTCMQVWAFFYIYLWCAKFLSWLCTATLFVCKCEHRLLASSAVYMWAWSICMQLSAWSTRCMQVLTGDCFVVSASLKYLVCKCKHILLVCTCELGAFGM